MHGRKKQIDINSEAAIEKRNIVHQKAKKYKDNLICLIAKVNEGNFSKELLEMSEDVLVFKGRNDMLWNYRKEYLNNCFANDPNLEKEENKQLFFNEMKLVEKSLKNDPKVYQTWHHRKYLANINIILCKNDLLLCQELLDYDSRNFHCWIYLMMILKLLNEHPSSEMKNIPDFMNKYTHSLIMKNFSNYSAWHYRSGCLKELCKQSFNTQNPLIAKEFQLIHNAFVTDPFDQSCWIFYRWLLTNLDSLDTNITPVKLLSTITSNQQLKVIIINSKPLNKVPTDLKITSNNQFLNGNVRFLGNPSSSRIIEFVSSDVFSEKQFEFNGESVVLDGNNSISKYYSIPSNYFGLFTVEPEFLLNQLLIIQELDEIEPGNKWINLTMVELMENISLSKHHQTIVKHLQHLQTLDPKRTNFYVDYIKKVEVAHQLLTTHADSNIQNGQYEFEKLLYGSIDFMNLTYSNETLLIKQ